MLQLAPFDDVYEILKYWTNAFASPFSMYRLNVDFRLVSQSNTDSRSLGKRMFDYINVTPLK